MRKILIITIILLSFSTFANGQAMPNYLFVEVVDSNKKPMSEAKVEIIIRNKNENFQTDEKGQIQTEWYGRSEKGSLAPLFIINKPDYYTFQDFGGMNEYNRRVKVELLKIPTNEKERKSLGNEQQKREFFFAIQNGDIEKVRKLLKSGISPNITIGNLRGLSGYEDIPAIIFSAGLGNGAIIKTLLKADADIHKKDEYTPKILFYFFRSSILEGLRYKKTEEQARIAKDYDEALSALIKAKIDVNEKTFNWSPLMSAISRGMVSSVKILIANGADVKAKASSNETLIRFAQSYYYIANNEEIIKILKEAGAKE